MNLHFHLWSKNLTKYNSAAFKASSKLVTMKDLLGDGKHTGISNSAGRTQFTTIQATLPTYKVFPSLKSIMNPVLLYCSRHAAA